MKLFFVFLVSVLSTTLAHADERTFTLTIDYKLTQENESIPVQFFTALDINEYFATLVNDNTGEISHCSSSTKIVGANQIGDVFSFRIEVSGSGPCEFSFSDQAGLIKMLTEDLKSFPVSVH